MAKIPLYNINSLASSQVGTPGVNRSGDMIAQSLLQGGSAVAAQSIAGQKQLRYQQSNNLANLAQGLGTFLRVRGAQKAQYEAELHQQMTKSKAGIVASQMNRAYDDIKSQTELDFRDNPTGVAKDFGLRWDSKVSEIVQQNGLDQEPDVMNLVQGHGMDLGDRGHKHFTEYETSQGIASIQKGTVDELGAISSGMGDLGGDSSKFAQKMQEGLSLIENNSNFFSEAQKREASTKFQAASFKAFYEDLAFRDPKQTKTIMESFDKAMSKNPDSVNPVITSEFRRGILKQAEARQDNLDDLVIGENGSKLYEASKILATTPLNGADPEIVRVGLDKLQPMIDEAVLRPFSPANKKYLDSLNVVKGKLESVQASASNAQLAKAKDSMQQAKDEAQQAKTDLLWMRSEQGYAETQANKQAKTVLGSEAAYGARRKATINLNILNYQYEQIKNGGKLDMRLLTNTQGDLISAKSQGFISDAEFESKMNAIDKMNALQTMVHSTKKDAPTLGGLIQQFMGQNKKDIDAGINSAVELDPQQQTMIQQSTTPQAAPQMQTAQQTKYEGHLKRWQSKNPGKTISEKQKKIYMEASKVQTVAQWGLVPPPAAIPLDGSQISPMLLQTLGSGSPPPRVPEFSKAPPKKKK